ncbi:hypothetical protein C8J55DRAFT_556712 [Lentinula edodes]|uniref:Uncharacterized protein n=1 Tax=Lentinula lateritia TaxID=40482 RepID=A0A9W9AUN2_9AGAR|nr:hypothetical protein C8J55DRAFT_556712 [Lentinula edodes]
MRLNYSSNLVFGVLAAAATAVVYGAPLGDAGTSVIGVSNSSFTTDSSTSAEETLHARDILHSQKTGGRKIQMKFKEPHAAPLGSHPLTPSRVKEILKDVVTDWLRYEKQPSDIELDFLNEFEGNMGEEYTVMMGSEVWREKCRSPWSCEVQLVDYEDDFNGAPPVGWRWDIVNDDEVLHVMSDRRLLPPYTH